MENRRDTSGLIPYKIVEGEIFVFLQKRSITAVRLPGYFAFFGGGIQVGETPQEAMRREVYEELDFVPEGYTLLGQYDFSSGFRSYYILKVDDGFETRIHVQEGEYGKFFSLREALSRADVSDDDKVVLRDLQQKLGV